MLAVAMVVSAALGLWLTRGTTFFIDEVTYFLASRGFDVRALLSPHNGHLILVPRLIYAVVFKLFGADYLVFRLLEVTGIAIAAGLFFTLAKRRVKPAIALCASVLLLFLGAGWVVTLTPLGITHVYCVIAGLGSLLALERAGRRVRTLSGLYRDVLDRARLRRRDRRLGPTRARPLAARLDLSRSPRSLCRLVLRGAEAPWRRVPVWHGFQALERPPRPRLHR